ncbi:MAG: MBL fold metallo-hydrolase [Lachnospiraceae bacterium]|nr:MBL fold metallo-hydrolase [Lachnospiraceae bacterium]
MKLCSIASGSSGNCIFAASDTTNIMIDAGISGKRIEEGLNEIGHTARDMGGILVTHEHSDHISGLGVVSRRYGIPIYATKGTKEAVLKCKSVGEIPPELFREIWEDEEFFIGDIKVSPISISHDAAQPTAFVLRQGRKSVGVMTDLGRYDAYIIEKLQNLDALLLEANHDVHMLQVGTYPYYLKQRILGDKGHLSNELSGRLLGEVLHDGFKAAVLGHLSKENNYERLAYETVRLEIDMADNPYHAGDFPIHVAKRDQVSDIIEI